MASVETSKMLAAAAEACDEKKAEDIRILALDPTESGLTDFFLICTGSNDRQTVAITDEIELRLKREFATYPNSVEGRRQGEWILMDYVDFIVHVFLPEKRAYYGLERLRPSATTLSIADLNAEIRAAITAKRPKKALAKEVTSDPEIYAEDGGTVEDAPAVTRRPGSTAKSGSAKSPAKRATAALKKAATKAASKAFVKSPAKAAAAVKRTSAVKKTAAPKRSVEKIAKKRGA